MSQASRAAARATANAKYAAGKEARKEAHRAANAALKESWKANNAKLKEDWKENTVGMKEACADMKEACSVFTVEASKDVVDIAVLTDRSRLHVKANEALNANLNLGETVQVIIIGASNQAIIGTECRVFVYKKGFMAGASFGSELTSFDYKNLIGVQLHKGMVNGTVILQGAGMSGQSTNTWKNTDNSPYKSPNAIPIAGKLSVTEAGVAKLRQLIAVAQRPATTQPVLSIADELKKLADLRVAGILGDDEFAAMKSALLLKF
jgi:Short C-terminal domain